MANAAELAYYVARVVFARDRMPPTIGLRITGSDNVIESNDVIHALERTEKPVKVVGSLHDSTVDILLRRNDAPAGHPQTPLLPGSPDPASVILVVAYDCLLRTNYGVWTEFARDYWFDAPLNWSIDEPASAFIEQLHLPSAALLGVVLVAVAGYAVPNGFQMTVAPREQTKVL
jgi:hypothetical protein